jgi:hypothetical protein
MFKSFRFSLFEWALAATAFYCGAVFSGVHENWTTFLGLRPNEVGDFLAGVFGPLAFLWLVFGYYQQGEELKHSVEALKLQAEELRNSVEQQKELVEVSQDTLNLQRELAKEQFFDSIKFKKPSIRSTFRVSSQTFSIDGIRSVPAYYKITAKVVGKATAYDVMIKALPASYEQPIISRFINELSENDGEVSKVTPEAIPYIQENVILEISFRDIDRREYSESYEYEFDEIEKKFKVPKLLSQS